jgi:hypothetical protein|tara:strand:- start:223 stop:648 length:426 start_codon:yes stop_codon:yes gene_type:complete
MTKIDYEKLGKSVGKLVAEKQQAYGDSFSKSHQILKVLYPDGIKPEQYMDVLTICRVVDKLFRLATDPTYGDESPWRDICGYSLLSMGKDPRETERDATPPQRIDEDRRTPKGYYPIKPIYPGENLLKDSLMTTPDTDKKV